MNLQKDDIANVAIIGGGPVGMFSVFAFGMQKLNCVLIDALDKIGGQCTSLYPEKYIYDIPAYPRLTAQELIDNLHNQIKPFSPKIELNTFVHNIIQKDGYFELQIQRNGLPDVIKANCVVIAIGSGVFLPVKLEMANISNFENKNIFYFLDDIKKFANANVAIVGGGDSAIDWALILSDIAKKVFLIHRREYIKAHPDSWSKAKNHRNIEIKIPFEINNINVEQEKFQGINIKNINNGNEEFLDVDFLLPCLGLKSNTQFLSNWALELNNHAIMVDYATMATSRSGIYAIGDCVSYSKKRKLIATGFGEAFQCAKDIFNYLHPEKAAPIGHSTSLGVPKLNF